MSLQTKPQTSETSRLSTTTSERQDSQGRGHEPSTLNPKCKVDVEAYPECSLGEFAVKIADKLALEPATRPVLQVHGKLGLFGGLGLGCMIEGIWALGLGCNFFFVLCRFYSSCARVLLYSFWVRVLLAVVPLVSVLIESLKTRCKRALVGQRCTLALLRVL